MWTGILSVTPSQSAAEGIDDSGLPVHEAGGVVLFAAMPERPAPFRG